MENLDIDEATENLGLYEIEITSVKVSEVILQESQIFDIVYFGEEDDGKPEKLEALLSAVNNNDSSHLVHVPPGPDALSDFLISTPVFTGDGEGGSGFAVAAAAATAAVIGGSSGYDFDVDPNIDPELALALRVSMEEERARQEAAAKKSANEAGKQGEESSSKSEDLTMTESTDVLNEDKKDTDDEDDEDLLKQALEMSMNIDESANTAADAEMSEGTSVDEELALARQLSMQESAGGSSSQSDVNKVLGNQSFLESILESLPGLLLLHQLDQQFWIA